MAATVLGWRSIFLICLAVRQADTAGLAFTALMAIAALVSVAVFIPDQARD